MLFQVEKNINQNVACDELVEWTNSERLQDCKDSESNTYFTLGQTGMAVQSSLHAG